MIRRWFDGDRIGTGLVLLLVVLVVLLGVIMWPPS